MLAQYLADTKNLLQLPEAPIALYSDESLTRFINIARGQVAGKGECIRVLGTLSTTANLRRYPFSLLDTGVSNATGVAGALHVRSIRYQVGDGSQWITPRPWEWFEFYSLNNIVPQSGPPASWSQYAQGANSQAVGSSASGSFFLDPPPDDVYNLACDTVCYPIDLTDDSTVEALPYLWTDAVPYFATYQALLSAQTGAREVEANRMYERYDEFMKLARDAANPSVLRWQSSQAKDPAQSAKFGMKQAG